MKKSPEAQAFGPLSCLSSLVRDGSLEIVTGQFRDMQAGMFLRSFFFINIPIFYGSGFVPCSFLTRSNYEHISNTGRDFFYGQHKGIERAAIMWAN